MAIGVVGAAAPEGTQWYLNEETCYWQLSVIISLQRARNMVSYELELENLPNSSGV